MKNQIIRFDWAMKRLFSNKERNKKHRSCLLFKIIRTSMELVIRVTGLTEKEIEEL